MEGKDELDHRAIAADISEDEHILHVSEKSGVSYLYGVIIRDINNIILDLDELTKVTKNRNELEKKQHDVVQNQSIGKNSQ